MQHKRAGVADIGQMGQQLAALDEGQAGFVAAFDAKGEDRPGAARQVARRPVMVRMVRQTGVGDPGNAAVLVEETGDFGGVFAMPGHARGGFQCR